MATSRIATRYSSSLLDLAKSGNKLDAVKDDMDVIVKIYTESKDLRSLLNNPIVKIEDKKAVLAKVFAGTDDTTRDFIGLLTDKRREGELANVATNFISSYNEMKGITSATVVTATALTGDALANMKSYVSTLLGKADINLTNDVDPTIIGGIIIKHEDKLLDKSVSKELREIRKQLIYN
jgi:F-type H+-transporting ATPase subunit delta